MKVCTNIARAFKTGENNLLRGTHKQIYISIYICVSGIKISIFSSNFLSVQNMLFEDRFGVQVKNWII